MATFNNNFKVKNGLDASGVVTSTGLSLLSTTSPITLNGSTGTSGQILTSAGSGNTPTWSSSFNGITGLSSTTPLSLGTAAVGTATTAARADHVHPTATTVVATVSGTNSAELVRGNMADNDQFRILVGGTATNTGFAEIATADDGTEPIHVRQYTGVFSTLVRTATLLDGSGNTSFPGSVSMTGALNVNTSGTGTLNLGDAQISKAPGSGFSFSSGIGSLTSLGIGTAANNASPLSVFFDTATKFNILRGAANQTADILRIQSSAGTILGGDNGVGQIYTGSTTPILTATGGTIQSIATGANPLVTMASAHGFAVGDLVTLAGTTGGTYNGTFVVASTPLTTTFTITTALTTGQAGAAGTASDPAQLSVTARSAGTIGAIIRGAVSQSANIFEVQNSSGTVLASVASNATFLINGIGVTAGDHRVGTSNYYTAALNVFARSVTEKGIALRANNTGQNANMIEVQSSAGTVVSGTSPNGQVFTGSTDPIRNVVGGATTAASGTGSVATITTTSAHNLAVGDRITVAGVTPTGYNGTFIATAVTSNTVSYANTTTGSQTVAGTLSVSAQDSVTIRSAGTTGIIVKAAASQVSNPFEVQNSSGSVIANVTSAGGVRATGTLQGSTLSAVADGSTIATLSASGNVQFRGAASYGGGVGVIGIANATTAPTSNPTGGGVLFVNSGALQYRGTSGSAATIVNADGTMAGGGTFTGGTLTSGLVLATGTTTLQPLKFVAGTNLTTPVTGVKEYDGTVFYSTANTNPGRALETQSYYYVSNSDFYIDYSGSGASQSMFGGPTTGLTVAAGTTYEFELDAAVQHQYQVNTGITGTFAMQNTGGATVAVTSFVDYGSNTTGFTTATTMSTVRTTGNVTFMAAISSGSRYGIIRVRGILRVTGSGTTKVYPGLAASATNDNTWIVASGAVFKMTPIGNGTVTTVGTWA